VIWAGSSAVMALSGQLWVSPARDALVTVIPREGPRPRNLVRLWGPSLLIIVALLATVGLLTGPATMVLVGASTVLIGVVPVLVVEHRQRPGPIRAARKVLAGTGVVEAGGLASASLGSGLRLGRALCAAADTAGVTVLAETRTEGRRRLYQRLDFTVVATGGGVTLLVREPHRAP
jgi:hypothetical protein